MDFIQPKSGSEVARDLNITRQTVSATTKRALGKMYSTVLKKGLADNPFDAMLVLMAMCNISNGVTEDVAYFLNLFPKEIQKEVKEFKTTSKFLDDAS